MKIGYVRGSLGEQALELQLEALRLAGCDRVFEDDGVNLKSEWPGLAQALTLIGAGDELVVWRLDRVGRSLQHLVNVIDQLRGKGARFRSVSENIETETTCGQHVLQLFASLAEFERSVARERARSGLATARARGRNGGRPSLPPEKINAINALWATNTMTAGQIGEQLGIHRATVFKYLSATNKGQKP